MSLQGDVYNIAVSLLSPPSSDAVRTAAAFAVGQYIFNVSLKPFQ